ncbi:MAG: hypothetical protein Q8P82_02560, partial [bacterium]|nr:hypothetical protein [bacterium]
MKIKAIVSAVVLVLAAGVGAGWYFFLREPDPQMVMRAMLAATGKAYAAHYEAAFTLTADLSNIPGIDELEEQSASVDSDLRSMVSSVFPENGNKKIDATVIVKGDLEEDPNTSLTKTHQTAFDVYVAAQGATSAIIAASGEVRSVDKVDYLKIDKMQLVLPLDLSTIYGQWYQFEGQKILDDLEKKKQEITGEDIVKKGITKEQKEKIIAAAQKRMIFTAVEVLPSEKVNDVLSYHYRFKLDPAETKALIKDVQAIMEEPMTAEQEKDLDKVLEKAAEVQQEAWIGKKDYLLYRHKISGTFNIDAPADGPFESSSESTIIPGLPPREKTIFKLPLSINGTYTYSKYNQPVMVTAPQ